MLNLLHVWLFGYLPAWRYGAGHLTHQSDNPVRDPAKRRALNATKKLDLTHKIFIFGFLGPVGAWLGNQTAAAKIYRRP